MGNDKNKNEQPEATTQGKVDASKANEKSKSDKPSANNMAKPKAKNTSASGRVKVVGKVYCSLHDGTYLKPGEEAMISKFEYDALKESGRDKVLFEG